jgi:hypothetical protein
MNKPVCYFIFLLIALTLPYLAEAKKADKKTATPAKAKVDTVKSVQPPAPPPKKEPEIIGSDVPVEQWMGKKFMCLRMPALFQKFGYELYTSPNLDKETMAIQPDIENKKHRLLYAPFVGKLLTVTAVSKPDSEYLLTFIDDASQLPVYGRTKKFAIQGIAFFDDRELAKKRWLGKDVFARKRHISTFDSVKSNVGSIKVFVQTPLKVVDIIFGLSPMPTQPLWIMVETPTKERGFIGTFFTWTNVMADLKKEYRPWTEDLYEENPQKTYTWGDDIWEQINTHNVINGMTKTQVLFAWNNPINKDTMAVNGKKLNRWTYQGQYVYFLGDTLVKIENK